MGRKRRWKTDPLTGIRYEKGSLMDIASRAERDFAKGVDFTYDRPTKRKSRGYRRERYGYEGVDLSQLPPWAQILVGVFIVGILMWAFLGETLSIWWSRYWIVITIAIILVVIGGVAFYIKVLLPIDREVTQELKREEELKKSIIRKRLLKERANQLEGLSDEEKEFQLKEWVEEEYKKEIPGYKSELRERFKKVPPLSAKEKERLIQIVGTRCCYPNCRENIALDVHHITPRAEGGTNKENNLIVLCPTHHRLARGGTIPRERLRQYSVANVKKIR